MDAPVEGGGGGLFLGLYCCKCLSFALCAQSRRQRCGHRRFNVAENGSASYSPSASLSPLRSGPIRRGSGRGRAERGPAARWVKVGRGREARGVHKLCHKVEGELGDQGHHLERKSDQCGKLSKEGLPVDFPETADNPEACHVRGGCVVQRFSGSGSSG